MKFFVSGSTGFIGSHLVKELTARGHVVHALVRSLNSATNIKGQNIILFQGDILDSNSIENAMEGCDGAYHLAAYVKSWAKEVKIYYDYNVKGTINILESAKRKNVKRTVITSTAGIYGPSTFGVVNENSTRMLDFFNPYESSKSIAESKTKDYVIEGLDVVTVSPTRVYGPHLVGNLKTDIITQMIKKYVYNKWRYIPGDGTEIGNFVYIDDIVTGHINAMEKGIKGRTYILGGDNQSFDYFFNEIAKISGIKRKMIHIPGNLIMFFSRIELLKPFIGKKPLITPGFAVKGKYNWEINSQITNTELGLSPTSLKEGLVKTIEWLRETQKY